MSTTPIFPPELERKLFELTAVLHPEMVPVLLLVAHRVLLIEHIPFVTIHIEPQTPKTRKERELLRAIRLKPPSFFSSAVRNLSLAIFKTGPRLEEDTHVGSMPSRLLPPGDSTHWTRVELNRVLHACTRIVNLSLTGSGIAQLFDAPMLDLVSHLRPVRLELHIFSATRPTFNFTLPFWQCLTHLQLYIANLSETPLNSAALALQNIPGLTHVALFRSTPAAVSSAVLLSCRNLQILVLIQDVFGLEGNATEQTGPPPVDDPRIVLDVLHNPATDWNLERETVSGAALWKRAEALIAKRRNGDLPADFYYV
ncbi:hypothetical protein GGX14DRAFT_557426 [Mycena pura]|uniref:Uncharacterized protein n=1 Tax=Mycena pura TaxID=153505 RepID=A0AAD6YNH8_9AGAR|nr:hypothetical protein GGX14DRAFT_557426 [Mycena pura]